MIGVLNGMTAIDPNSPIPEFLTTTVQTRSGETIVLRPLWAGESVPLGIYFAGLSAESRARYGPHRFDQETADSICATLAHHEMLRMVGVGGTDEGDRFIAYVLLKHGVHEGDRARYERLGIPLHSETDCTLAPSVLDSYQNQGIGSLFMRHVLDCAKRLGYRRVVLWGGVQATNLRAVHLYTKFGFVKVGEFFNDKDNDDMILDLSAL